MSGVIAYLFKDNPTWRNYSYFLKLRMVLIKIYDKKEYDDIKNELDMHHKPNQIIPYSPSSNTLLEKFFSYWYFVKKLSIMIFVVSTTIYVLENI